MTLAALRSFDSNDGRRIDLSAELTHGHSPLDRHVFNAAELDELQEILRLLESQQMATLIAQAQLMAQSLSLENVNALGSMMAAIQKLTTGIKSYGNGKKLSEELKGKSAEEIRVLAVAIGSKIDTLKSVLVGKPGAKPFLETLKNKLNKVTPQRTNGGRFIKHMTVRPRNPRAPVLTQHVAPSKTSNAGKVPAKPVARTQNARPPAAPANIRPVTFRQAAAVTSLRLPSPLFAPQARMAASIVSSHRAPPPAMKTLTSVSANPDLRPSLTAMLQMPRSSLPMSGPGQNPTAIPTPQVSGNIVSPPAQHSGVAPSSTQTQVSPIADATRTQQQTISESTRPQILESKQPQIEAGKKESSSHMPRDEALPPSPIKESLLPPVLPEINPLPLPVSDKVPKDTLPQPNSGLKDSLPPPVTGPENPLHAPGPKDPQPKNSAPPLPPEPKELPPETGPKEPLPEPGPKDPLPAPDTKPDPSLPAPHEDMLLDPTVDPKPVGDRGPPIILKCCEDEITNPSDGNGAPPAPKPNLPPPVIDLQATPPPPPEPATAESASTATSKMKIRSRQPQPV